jgi:hypothetical protein
MAPPSPPSTRQRCRHCHRRNCLTLRAPEPPPPPSLRGATAGVGGHARHRPSSLRAATCAAGTSSLRAGAVATSPSSARQCRCCCCFTLCTPASPIHAPAPLLVLSHRERCKSERGGGERYNVGCEVGRWISLKGGYFCQLK